MLALSPQDPQGCPDALSELLPAALLPPPLAFQGGVGARVAVALRDWSNREQNFGPVL